MKKLRWGILGCAKIAREYLIPAIQSSSNSEVIAIASRSLEKSQAFARTNNIPKSYGSYQELLDDPEIDVVYNPMPNHMHVPWSIKALVAGKHVLCEKPLGMSEEDIMPLVMAAKQHPNLCVMEAFMYRFHPQWAKAREIVSSGMIGEIKMIDATFTYNSFNPENVRYQSDIGGGALLDVGCYCISAARFLFAKEPLRVMGCLDMDPVCNVDRHVSGLMDFGSGVARFTSSMQVEGTQGVTVLGTKGRMEIESPFFLPAHKMSKLTVSQQGREEGFIFENTNHYVCQVEAFSESILANAPAPTPIEDACNNMKVIDALFHSNEEKIWVEL